MNTTEIVSSLILLTLTLWSARRYLLQGQTWSALWLILASLGLFGIVLQESWVPWAQNKLGSSKALVAVLDSDQISKLSTALTLKLSQSDTIQLKGDGFRSSQWHDIPARRLEWQAPQNRPILDLQFASSIARGREFVLQLRRVFPQHGEWRAQLLAENGKVLTEATGSEDTLTLRWLPPLAEQMVLQAKAWDGEGKLLDSGPIPLDVKDPQALRVWGRFDAASFDVAALQNLLRQSQAVIDWQTRLGQQIQHVEVTPSSKDEQSEADLMIVDAAYVEQLSTSNRQTLLARVAQGKVLLVLGANAKQAEFWRTQFQLNLQASTTAFAGKENAEQMVDVDGVGSLALSQNSLSVKTPNAIWRAALPSSKATNPSAYLWQRPWQNGQLAWLDVGDWHRQAIGAPKKVAAWWQAVLDQIYQKPGSNIRWSMSEVMPLVGERQTVCLEGLQRGSVKPATESVPISLYGLAEILDRACAAWRPTQVGWQGIALQSPELTTAQQHAFYIYPADAWPTWQRHLKSQATQAYAQALAANAPLMLPAFPMLPLYLLTATFFLCLWRRDTQNG